MLQQAARAGKSEVASSQNTALSSIGHGLGIAEILYSCETAVMRASLTITSRGVITLPAKLRQALGLKADDQLIAETTPEGLLLRPAVTLPIELYTQEREREFDSAEQELAAVLDKAPSLKQERAAGEKRKTRR